MPDREPQGRRGPSFGDREVEDLIEAVVRDGLRAVDIKGQHSWFLDTGIVRERARSQMRSSDAPAELSDFDYVRAAWSVVESAVRASTPTQEALHFIGASDDTLCQPLAVRKESAAFARKKGNYDGKHWASKYGRPLKRRMALELYGLIVDHGVEPTIEEGRAA